MKWHYNGTFLLHDDCFTLKMLKHCIEQNQFFISFLICLFCRHLTGQLNNLNNSDWGAVGVRLRRLAGNAYVDGISTPSGACTTQQRLSNSCPFPNELSGVGSHRPSPREISNTLMAQVCELIFFYCWFDIFDIKFFKQSQNNLVPKTTSPLSN